MYVSVPSTEPFDWLVFKELETNHILRSKYQLKQEMFFDHIPVIKTESNGEFIASNICASVQVSLEIFHFNQLKVSSSTATKIEYAEDLASVAISTSGIMLNGTFKGQSAKLVKQQIISSLVASGFAFEHAQPSAPTLDTKGEECVVKRSNTWEVKFSNQEWKNEVKE